MDVFFKVKKEAVAFVCSIIEECEGIATVRTPEPQKGENFTILKAMVSPNFVENFGNILNTLKEEIELEIILP